MNPTGYLVLETGQIFSGRWRGGRESAGEVVFNTGHSGYEEMATDPSYFSQILVTTATMQGNYGENDKEWESEKIWIRGFICLEMQESSRDHSWLDKLTSHKVPVLSDIDTRNLVITLREQGTTWGAIIQASSEKEAFQKAKALIQEEKTQDKDWVSQVTCSQSYILEGHRTSGPKVAVMDFGCKKNTLRELQYRCSEVRVYPSKTSAKEILSQKPDGVLLSNGPGDPEDVQMAAETVKSLLGQTFVFGICMGHQILARALGLKTYRLKFGHRGSNHPIKDLILNKIYMTSQNHGYAVESSNLGQDIEVTHWNLNDNTVSGIQNKKAKCLSVQFHPESRPGPHDAETLFDYFIKQVQ
ncbi:MAG: glutamine-hydrolyzing carbamoyl-phosphate synthase small subunit [Bdellovibrionales bacterium]|nr:glutamine-hydrolyzing carbamoyl-phosphate synthase small subunit [Bdellovibrionales bacterium]